MAITFAAIFAVLAMLYGWRTYSSQVMTPPSDDEMARVFHANRDKFERLRQMAIEDMRETSVLSDANLSAKLPISRRNEYKTLLKLSPGLEVGANYDGTVRFIFASTGAAIGPGWAKGIEFVPDMGKVVGVQRGTLDDSAKFPPGVYFLKLEPQWLLFFQRDE